MQNKENLPTEPGSTITVVDEYGYIRCYVLALYGVWKPIDHLPGYGLPKGDGVTWFPAD